MIKTKKIKALLLALGISASALFSLPVPAAEETGASSGTIATNAIPGWPQGPDITSEAAVVMDEETNTILYSKNMDSPPILPLPSRS